VHRDPLARPRALRRLAIAVATLAVALAAAPAAAAPPRKDASAKAGTRATPSQELPPPPAAAPLGARRAGWLALSAGAWAGLDSGQGGAVQLDYGIVRTPEGWSRLQLEVRLAATIGRPTDSTDLTTVYGGRTIPSGTEKTSAWIVEVVPGLRLLYPVSPKFSLFGEAGLGLVQTIEKHERDELFAGHTDTTKNVTGLVFRLGAGMSFTLSERTRLLFLPVALSLQAGTGFSAYVPTLGLAYRL
jgi:opacity protein-like surface antigen